MLKSPFTAIAAALVLSACAGRVGLEGYAPVLVTTPDPKLPNIFVSDGGLVIDQEPIRTGTVGQSFTVVWALPLTGPVVFGEKGGIEFADPKPINECASSAKFVTCKLTLTKKEHKYTINASRRVGTEGRLEPLAPLDPHLVGN
jgi:hypothetical protein